MTSYGIVFSGGGALGAWEVGCYKAIHSKHHGDSPQVVTGASAGAINAAGVCANMLPAQLEELWGELTSRDIYKPRINKWTLAKLAAAATGQGIEKALISFLRSQPSILDNKPIATTLRSRLNRYYHNFEQSRVRVALSVTNLTNKCGEFFYKNLPSESAPDGGGQFNDATWTKIDSLDLLVAALSGSTALPILFSPTQHYFDGGILLNQPISPALHLHEPDILYVVIPSSKQLGKTDNIVDLASTLFSVWLGMSLDAQIENIKLLNRLRENEGATSIRLCVIRPHSDLTEEFGVSLLNFGTNVEALVTSGFEAANQKINRFEYGDEATWY